jgi:HK97 family phage prohead protease
MSIKAFSAFVIKSVNEDAREFEGIASTPTLDRVKDSVKPEGLRYQSEVPLLLNHNHAQPVGSVVFGKATSKGLPFKGKIAKVDEDGTVKQRTDEAWHSVKHGIIKGVSIGFKPEEYEPNKAGGMDFTKAEVHELSLVSIPCNPEAVITAFKSLEAAEANAQAEAEVLSENTQEQDDAARAAAEAVKEQEEAESSRKALELRKRKILLFSTL